MRPWVINYRTTQISCSAALTNEDTPYYTMTGYMLLRVVDDRECTPVSMALGSLVFFKTLVATTRTISRRSFWSQLVLNG
jgi:hypothetical protein